MRRLAVTGWLVLLPLWPACQCDEPDLIDAKGVVEGKACNPLTGQPEPGMTLRATFPDPRTKEPITQEVAAADDGSFTFPLPVGTQTVEIVHAKFEKSFEVEIIANQVTIWKDDSCRELALPAGTGEIIGQICNRHTGSFVQEATVTVLLPDGTELSTTTDADGNFILSEVPEGVHIVYVRATGFQKTYQVEVEAGEQTQLEEQQRACEPPDPLTTGFVKGTICAPDPSNPGATTGEPLQGARVYLVQPIDGYVFEDETLEDGSFLIAGIPTPQSDIQVRAEKGGFTYTWDGVDVFAQAEAPNGTELTLEDECQPLQPDDGLRYLVVNGYYDKIQNVLERMGLGNVDLVEGNPLDLGTHWAADVFGDYERMNQYDAIFVNCGVDQIDFQSDIDPVVKANLRQYVQQGGSLYVSDWAYDLVEKVWPEKIDFYGDDAEADAAEYGAPGAYTADVLDPGLAEYLGQDALTIDYDFRGSALVRQVASGTTVYLRTDMGYEVNNGVSTLDDTPITVGFTDGPAGVGGRVIFTSFHQESDTEGNVEVLDGPEDAVLRYLVFAL